jgi:hypothetical protein
MNIILIGSIVVGITIGIIWVSSIAIAYNLSMIRLYLKEIIERKEN